MKINKQPIKENLIVFGFFMGLILPLRLLFYQYFHEYWVGSFGIYSLVLFAIFYLSKRGKLGSIGTLLTRKITKMSQGKLAKGFIVQSIVVIYMGSLFLLGSSSADPGVVNMVTTDFHKQGIHDMKSLTSQPLPSPTPIQLLVSIVIVLTPNPISFAMYNAMNQISSGWILSLMTIVLIEEIEVLCIILFLRYRNKIRWNEFASQND